MVNQGTVPSGNSQTVYEKMMQSHAWQYITQETCSICIKSLMLQSESEDSRTPEQILLTKDAKNFYILPLQSLHWRSSWSLS